MVGNMKRLDEFLLIIKELGVKVATDSDENTPYLVIPNTRNPKWLMPLDKKSIKKNSFLLYQASTIKGKILKKIYESIPNIVIKILFFNNIIYLNTEKFLYDLNNKNNLININTASIQELDTLPGIGEATANKIVNYREEKGKFNSIEEIKNVNGIGDKKYEELKTLISIE